MSTVDPQALNRDFGLPSISFREGPGGLAVAEIDNAQASATVFLQGAQLTAWTPRGHEPVIWLSQQAVFAEGKPIRGGIPLCWPWFGAHATEPGFPAHGFARTANWKVVATEQKDDGSSLLVLRLPTGKAGLAFWPHSSPVEARLTIGETLQVELATHNLDAQHITIGQALHAYFRVGDIGRIKISGLEGCPYVDKADGGKRKRQQGPVAFTAEVDRIYLDSTVDCLIDDPLWNRCIRISKRGSSSTIIWNPWKEKSEALVDMGAEGYHGMVCVESANVADDVVILAPGEEHSLWVNYAVETR